MANVHRLGDYENNPNYNRMGQGQGAEGYQQDMQRLRALNVPFMSKQMVITVKRNLHTFSYSIFNMNLYFIYQIFSLLMHLLNRHGP